ncbi:MAG: hypothetical protein A3E80_02305 [Chlamydiae bacterium RIFCSPHIGHO2_12_FULL_49_9]|nr:MAG: hypothetical protein A3E80_02305 [Chlamydiae bacterium RIFCSPHIGHO2_12_FULL_49_9]
MANYYFLITALPPLKLGIKPEISFKEAKELFDLNLAERDKKLVQHLLRPIDLSNIRALWMGLPIDDRGNFDEKEIEEALLVQGEVPEYLAEFLERYESIADRLRYFSSLYASLYRREFKGFLGKYYRFQREFRLVLTALRSKQFKRDISRELQFEDPRDPIVAEILAQKDAPDYSPAPEYEDLKTVFMETVSDPQKLHFALLEYQFDRIEEMEEPQDFAIDRVLSYIARLILVESWEELDQEKGHTAVEHLSHYG